MVILGDAQQFPIYDSGYHSPDGDWRLHPVMESGDTRSGPRARIQKDQTLILDDMLGVGLGSHKRVQYAKHKHGVASFNSATNSGVTRLPKQEDANDCNIQEHTAHAVLAVRL